MKPPDRARVKKALAMLSADNDGIRIAAVNAIGAILKKSGLSFPDLAEEPPPPARARIQTVYRDVPDPHEWNKGYNYGHTQGHAEGFTAGYAAAMRENGYQRPPEVKDKRAPAAQARAALELHADGDIKLSQFEADFLRTVAHWRGSLTDKQEPIFQSIMEKFGIAD